jgi:hypothetical protein
MNPGTGIGMLITGDFFQLRKDNRRFEILE